MFLVNSELEKLCTDYHYIIPKNQSIAIANDDIYVVVGISTRESSLGIFCVWVLNVLIMVNRYKLFPVFFCCMFIFLNVCG